MPRESTPAKLLGKRKRGRPSKNAFKELKSDRNLYTEWVRSGFVHEQIENYYKVQLKHLKLGLNQNTEMIYYRYDISL